MQKKKQISLTFLKLLTHCSCNWRFDQVSLMWQQASRRVTARHLCLRPHTPDTLSGVWLVRLPTLSLALMTIFMKKYFSSVGIKSTGCHPLRVHLLLQRAMWVTYGIYISVHVTLLSTVSVMIPLLCWLFFVYRWLCYLFIYFFFTYSVCQCLQKWSLEESFIFYFTILLLCIKVYTENYNMKCLNYFAQSCNGPVGVGDRIC